MGRPKGSKNKPQELAVETVAVCNMCGGPLAISGAPPRPPLEGKLPWKDAFYRHCTWTRKRCKDCGQPHIVRTFTDKF